MLQSTLDTSISNAFQNKGSLRNQPSSASTKFLTSRRLASCRQKCSPFRSNPEPTSKSGSVVITRCSHMHSNSSYELLIPKQKETPKLKVSLVPQYESNKARKWCVRSFKVCCGMLWARPSRLQTNGIWGAIHNKNIVQYLTAFMIHQCKSRNESQIHVWSKGSGFNSSVSGYLPHA